MGSVHEGVPPLRRCTLYDGLEGQDVTTQSPTTEGSTPALIRKRFSPTCSWLSLSYRKSLRFSRAQRLVVGFTDPQPMQQHRQFAGYSDHRPFLAALAPALRQS